MQSNSSFHRTKGECTESTLFHEMKKNNNPPTTFSWQKYSQEDLKYKKVGLLLCHSQIYLQGDLTKNSAQLVEKRLKYWH